MATLGHVLDLPKDSLAVDVKKNFELTLKPIPKKQNVITNLQKFAKQAKSVVIATDPDREGESIAANVAALIDKQNSNVHRALFYEITKSSILESIHANTNFNTHLVEAQKSRRALDRLFGYTVSPELWKQISGVKSVSGGRVQSTALKWITDREQEINNFQPQTYFLATIVSFGETWNLKKDSSNRMDAKEFQKFLKDLKLANPFPLEETFSKQKHELNEKQVVKVANEKEVSKKTITDSKEVLKIVSISREKKSNHPPPAFTTASFQQAAISKLGISGKQAMSIAQKLYEGVSIPGHGRTGLITYMRTESTRISAGAVRKAHDWIAKNLGKAYVGKFRTGGKTEGAHEAIRPTYVDKTPADLETVLSPLEAKVYSLIWNRFNASLSASREYEKVVFAGLAFGKEWILETEHTLFEGYYRFTPFTFKKTPDLKVGMEDAVSSLNFEKKQTEPPLRFTEASLIQKMEKEKIGRPSTYASTLEILKLREYISLEKKYIVPKELGKLVIRFLADWIPDFVKPEFTKKMEEDLDQVAEGKKTYLEVVKPFYESLKSALQKKSKANLSVLSPVPNSFGEGKSIEKTIPSAKVPKMTNKSLQEFEKPKSAKSRNKSEKKSDEQSDAAQEKENSNLEKINIILGQTCPLCKEGKIINRMGRKSGLIYYCSRYPYCEFVHSPDSKKTLASSPKKQKKEN